MPLPARSHDQQHRPPLLVTHASLLGWGCTCLSQAVGGRWDHTPSIHINCLELATVLKVVKHFTPVLRGRHVMVRSDSTTAVAYINRQGGVRSARLLEISRELLAHQTLLSIRAVHVHRKQNRAADLMSRDGPQPSRWRLNPALAQTLWDRFGRAVADLFAAHGNAQCCLWFSLYAGDDLPLGVDAFVHHPWPRALLYAFPPVSLIPRLLSRVQDERLHIILIAPEGTSAAWFPTMVHLLAGDPWQLSWQGDALSQLEGAIQQFPVIGQRLWAWRA